MSANRRTFTPPPDLLITKLTAPVQRLKIVKRTRLTDRLRNGMASKLTLVVAPAGYGKTTLLREWMNSIESIGWPVAWLSLDSEDNGILQFWSYIVGAVQTVASNFHFDPSNLSALPCETIDYRRFNPLLNQIAAVPRHFSLILDDYHEIKNPLIHQSITYFIEHLPENFHLVIASRITPPLPLARLRILRQLEEIYAPDLSFTLEEARTFLEKVMEVRVSGEDIIGLNHLSEGWAVGLQLAGVSLKNGYDAKSLLANFAGTNRHIVAYLTEEVLNRLDVSVKDFLIKTSILTRLSAPLCDYLLETTDSHEKLNDLEQANLLISPLDIHRQWYRYHALFAEFLKNYLALHHPGLAPKLHLRACHWFEANGYPEQVIPHALEAGETEKAIDIVETSALKGLLHLDFLSATQWLDRLPKDIFKNRPQLTLMSAKLALSLGLNSWYGALANELEKIVQQGAGTTVDEPVSPRLLVQGWILQATEACLLGDFDRAIAIADQVLSRRSEVDRHSFGMMEHFLSYAYLVKGDLEGVDDALGYALETGYTLDLHEETVTALCTKARAYKFFGKLPDAGKYYQQAIDYAREKKLESGVVNLIYAGLGDIVRQMNQIELADQFSAIAQDAFSRYGTGPRVWIYVPDLPLHLADDRLAHKDVSMAMEYLQDARAVSHNYYQVPFLRDQIELFEVRLAVENGDRQLVDRWLNRSLGEPEEQKSALSPIMKLAAARALVFVGKSIQAARLLMDEAGLPENLAHIRVEWYILLALAHFQLGEYRTARLDLLSALKMGFSGGYIRVFLNEGATLKRLLKDVIKHVEAGDHGVILSPEFKEYLNRVLHGFDVAYVDQHALHSDAPVISTVSETISEREIEILKMLANGLSTGEVACRLSISVNTVRTHLKHLFVKLDVHAREEAIHKAIQLELM